MKILFVSSANRNEELNPVVVNQAQSLSKEGIEISYFGVRGKGIRGYLRNVISLRKEIKKVKPDVVHAHYVLSGVIAKLAGAKPLLVSLMGSDIKGSRWQWMMSKIFAGYFWDGCIVKTSEMKSLLRNESVHVVPNGVDMDLFKPEPKEIALKETGWDPEAVNILFPSDPERPEKNFRLAEEALSVMEDPKIRLHILKNVQREKVVIYLNASDVVLLTSRWEGSPNIIKEAMACNIPVVSTKVGDVEEIFNGTDGCYLSENSAVEIGRALKHAIAKKRTDGRSHISYLDSGLVARRIIDIYSNLVLKKTR